MKNLYLFFAFILFCSFGFAQEGAAVANGGVSLEAALHALGLALNTGGVYMLVFLILKWRPKLKETAPQYIPMIAIIAGPALNAAAVFVSQAAGIDIDFSPVIAALAGPSAVTIDQLYRQKRKAKPSRPGKKLPD